MEESGIFWVKSDMYHISNGDFIDWIDDGWNKFGPFCLQEPFFTLLNYSNNFISFRIASPSYKYYNICFSCVYV